MKFKPIYKLFKLLFILFNILTLLTIFLPFVSIDKYVEYEFSTNYYNEDYQSHTTPIAKEIKSITIVESLFTDFSGMFDIFIEYDVYKSKLGFKLQTNQISIEEYNDLLSSHPVTNRYKFLSVKHGHDEELSRLQGQTSMYSILLFCFYIICLITLISNILNLKLNKKLLNYVNMFGGWIMTILLTIFNFYSFGLMLTSKNQISGFSGQITEHTSICFSPKLAPILLVVLLITYSIFSIILNKKEENYKLQNKEIPAALAIALNKSHKIYIKTNSKKSKYKNGSKKKRNR